MTHKDWPIVLVVLLFSMHTRADSPFPLTVLHTNDLHSYFWGNGPDISFTEADDADPVIGHYARLASAIKQERLARSTNSATLTLDAGDWFGGTIFHSIAPRPDNALAPELFLFAKLDYDVATLGNHEFDAGEIGLATMLSKYKKSAFAQHFFQLVLSNNRQWGRHLQPFVDDGTIKQHFIKTLQFNGQQLKVGILGALGPDAALVSTNLRKQCTFFGFDEQKVKIDVAQLVDQLKNQAAKLKQLGAQALILVIHAGTPEDTEIAQLMPELDLIIAGHTHELYLAPKIVGKTIIAQAGEYGKNIGILPLSWSTDHFVLLPQQHYHRPINDSIRPDVEVMNWTKDLWQHLTKICRKHGADCREEIYKLTTSHPKDFKNPILGKLVTSILRQQLSKVWQEEVDLYFTSFAMVRSGLLADEKNLPTPQLFSDVFRVFPLGIDEETQELGYKTEMMYLSKREVELLINFMEIYRRFSKNFVPAFSDDLEYQVRPWGIPMLNSLKNLKWRGKSFEEWPERMAVASNQYVADYLDKVGRMTWGLVTFNPTDKSGKPVAGPIRSGPPEFEILTEGLRQIKILP